ncbi:Phospholipid scramblase 1 [Folsomia candida]|uniref:Phospholipid scramblase n=1 Tax=Folsomia candida TaxID=158441 RepID=A0A226DZX0_FOLCA|nr:Phospholipid scramblase 1 [Folsomia candida]
MDRDFKSKTPPGPQLKGSESTIVKENPVFHPLLLRRRKKKKKASGGLGRVGGVFTTRPQRPRRRHLVELENSVVQKRGPFQLPTSLAAPSDLGHSVKRFLAGRWVPSKMDFLLPFTDPEIPGVPRGQLSSMVGNRYHVLCGDTKNRIFYGVVKYPVCMGCLAGYKPFRLFVMNYNLDIVLHFEKSISCRLFWCFGGYGTKIRVTGPSGELYGTIMQRFSLLRPNFDLLDENDSRVLSIQGPPIIPLPLSYLQFLTKFKLYQHDPHEEEGEGDQVGIFLEAAYGVGNRNMKNSLRVGFPRDLPIRHKALVLAALFQIVLRSISYFIICFLRITSLATNIRAVHGSHSDCDPSSG